MLRRLVRQEERQVLRLFIVLVRVGAALVGPFESREVKSFVDLQLLAQGLEHALTGRVAVLFRGDGLAGRARQGRPPVFALTCVVLVPEVQVRDGRAQLVVVLALGLVEGAGLRDGVGGVKQQVAFASLVAAVLALPLLVTL